MKRGLWQRIKRTALTDVSVLVRGVPAEAIEDFERILVEADFGPLAFELVETLEEEVRRGTLKREGALRDWLTSSIVELAGSGDTGQLALGERGPGVVVLLGVNGVGKTTQLAKLAHRLRNDGRSVLLAAADTFRAGAGEQLQIWADRIGCPCVRGTSGGDPAAVAFDAIEAAEARDIDVVLVDTAGRLHTEQDLMSELAKVVRVVGRRREGAPHESLLVLDATVGQNALVQGRTFADTVPVTGLIVTKVDGTARGGAVVAMRHALGIPIRFLGTGEGLDDLEPFDPARFADRLLGD